MSASGPRDWDGWFHTGDLARCDDEGFFYIAGRVKDMLISGGVNVYPAEIEPRRWLFVDALPRTAYGKVVKSELRQRLIDGA